MVKTSTLAVMGEWKVEGRCLKDALGVKIKESMSV